MNLIFAFRRIIAAICLTLATFITLLCGEALANILPQVNCVEETTDGTLVAHWGYQKDFSGDFVLAPGTNSALSKNVLKQDGIVLGSQPQPGAARSPFIQGTKTDVFSTAFASGSSIEWTIQFGSQGQFLYSAKANKDSMRCVQPKLACIHEDSNGTYTAHFGYLPTNCADLTIPVGPDNILAGLTGASDGGANYFDPFNQINKFIAAGQKDAFLVNFDGKTLAWKVTYNGVTFSAEATKDSPLCPKPLVPIFDCAFDNQDGTSTAYFGYKNYNAGSVSVPVGNLDGQSNFFDFGAGFDETTANIGQPTNFATGENHAIFSTLISASTPTLGWSLQYQGSGLTCVPETKKLCALLTPKMECIDTNDDGSITARFSYNNENTFALKVPVGTANSFSPAPTSRNQPTTFLAGNNVNVFNVSFDPKVTPSLTWNLAGFSVSADKNSRQCRENLTPLCNVNSILENLACQGTVSTFALDGSKSSDPENAKLTYSWTSTCANAQLKDASAPTASLLLSTPGTGTSQSCEVSLTVSDGFTSASCGAKVSVNACNLDCLKQPNGSAKLDSCGVCNGSNACLDCSGAPFGTKKIDSCGVCGGNNACIDCAGTPKGSAKLDRCGVCNGNGQSCLGCLQSDITKLLFALDNNAQSQKNLVTQTVNKLLKKTKSKAEIRKLRKIAAAADEFYKQNWSITWSIPSITNICTNVQFCAQGDRFTTLASYNSISAQLSELTAQALKVVKTGGLSKRQTSQILLQSEGLYQQSLRDSNQVPRFESSCS